LAASAARRLRLLPGRKNFSEHTPRSRVKRGGRISVRCECRETRGASLCLPGLFWNWIMPFPLKNRLLRWEYWFLWTPIILYLPFVFLGYGADSDSYETLRTGTTFIADFDYIPSRNPGYFVFEVITFLANSIGGSIATNVMSVLMSAVCLYGFYRLCRALSLPNSSYLALALAFHPYYWVASTTTMDYVFALGFFFLGVSLLLDGKRPIFAGIAFSLAVGCRLTTVLLVILALVLLVSARLISLKVAAASIALTAIFAAVFYIPPLDFVKWRWWRIFKPVMGEGGYWSLYLRAGRFFYKNIVFWSAPILLYLIGMIVYFLLKRVKIEGSPFGLMTPSFLIVIAYEIMFFFVPLDPSYLLAGLPFALIIVGILLFNRKKMLLVFLSLVLLSNFIVVNFARPDVENFATGASYGLWLEPGYLIEATRERMKVMDCADLTCYETIMQR
jgi:hypothetical protein